MMLTIKLIAIITMKIYNNILSPAEHTACSLPCRASGVGDRAVMSVGIVKFNFIFL